MSIRYQETAHSSKERPGDVGTFSSALWTLRTKGDVEEQGVLVYNAVRNVFRSLRLAREFLKLGISVSNNAEVAHRRSTL
jgi:hypothetical protein